MASRPQPISGFTGILTVLAHGSLGGRLGGSRASPSLPGCAVETSSSRDGLGQQFLGTARSAPSPGPLPQE